MTEDNLNFCQELIKQYGIDRFYHCAHRMLGEKTILIYYFLNQENFSKNNCIDFLKSLSLYDFLKLDNVIQCVESYQNKEKDPIGLLRYGYVEHNTPDRSDICSIACAFSLYYKEFGLRSHKLPDHLHARMIFSENNKWVLNYINNLKEKE